MAFLFHRTGSHRKHGTLLAFVYFWLCIVLPCQHTHTEHEVIVSPPPVSVLHKAASGHLVSSQQAAWTPNHKAPHCAACDWEALTILPILPTPTPALEIPRAPLVITTFPRYLQRYVASRSARAPPPA